jgi:2-C-methyl-D-erythritol 4-phosphate cytidylyltransferase
MAEVHLGLAVVAAGRGERLGRDKVWEPLGGEPVVARALAALAVPPVERVALVVAAARLADGQALARRLALPAVAVPGGTRRQDSVRNGLLALGPCEWVAVHDAARPFATREILVRTLAAAQRTGAAVAAVPVVDTIKRVADGLVVETPPRGELWAVQTPQVFRGELLARAHREQPDDATDDAALVERCGVKVGVAEGAYDNIKITTPEDLELAAWLWARRAGKQTVE